MEEQHKTVPAVLTSMAFLLAWFLVCIGILYVFLHAVGIDAAAVVVYENLSAVVIFYGAVAMLVILFSVWFASHFYRADHHEIP
jgi:hypothetical protein